MRCVWRAVRCGASVPFARSPRPLRSPRARPVPVHHLDAARRRVLRHVPLVASAGRQPPPRVAPAAARPAPAPAPRLAAALRRRRPPPARRRLLRVRHPRGMVPTSPRRNAAAHDHRHQTPTGQTWRRSTTKQNEHAHGHTPAAGRAQTSRACGRTRLPETRLVMKGRGPSCKRAHTHAPTEGGAGKAAARMYSSSTCRPTTGQYWEAAATAATDSARAERRARTRGDGGRRRGWRSSGCSRPASRGCASAWTSSWRARRGRGAR